MLLTSVARPWQLFLALATEKMLRVQPKEFRQGGVVQNFTWEDFVCVSLWMSQTVSGQMSPQSTHIFSLEAAAKKTKKKKTDRERPRKQSEICHLPPFEQKVCDLPPTHAHRHIQTSNKHSQRCSATVAVYEWAHTEITNTKKKPKPAVHMGHGLYGKK